MTCFMELNFQGLRILKTAAVILLFTGILPNIAIVQNHQLFPYLGVSDAKQFEFDFERNNYTDVPFLNTFQFLGKKYSKAYINGLGIITFGEGYVGTYYQCTPGIANLPTIGAYMAGTRLQYDPPNMKLIYRSKIINPTELEAAQKDILVGFPSLAGKFSLRELLIVTWHNMPPYASERYLHLRNTFQAVLATDYKHSFLLLYYSRIEWPTFKEEWYSATVGIFGGGENITNTYLLPGSCSRDFSLVNIASQSNIDQPGKFVFRVDNNIELPRSYCLPISTSPRTEPLQLLPAVVPVMGSVPLLVRGFDVCLNHSVTRVNCTFHDINREEPVIVEGSVISGQLAAICSTPSEFYSLGRVRIDLTLQFSNGQVVETYGFVYVVTTLYSRSANVTADLNKDNNNKTTLTVSWDTFYFEKILQETSSFFRINLNEKLKIPGTLQITMMELRGSKWLPLYVINNVTNSGQRTFSPSPSAQTKLISDEAETLARTVKFRGTVRTEGGQILLLEFVSGVEDTTSVLARLKQPAYYEKKCQLWHDNEATPPSDSLACPDTVEQAVADWRFSLSEAVKSTNVFMQSVPSSSGAASRCVYGDTGKLVIDQPSESFLFRQSPNGRRTYWGHLQKDLIPFEECCRWNNFTQFGCQKYFFPKGPLHHGFRYEFPTPFLAYGCTHVTTMDGEKFYFNGVGFYWLYKCPSHFDIQVLLEIFNYFSDLAMITGVVIKSYAGGDGEYTNKFQLAATTTFPRKLLIWMDDQPLNFYHDKLFNTYKYLEDNFTLYNDGVSVKIIGTTEALLSFSTGVSMKVTLSTKYGFLSIVGLMSKTMKWKNATGLLGIFDGDENNYEKHLLVEKLRVVEKESLFVTPPGTNYSIYHTPNPDFQRKPNPRVRGTHDAICKADSVQTLQDFERLVNANKIVSLPISKECEQPTNFTNGGYLGESVSLHSSIQFYCADGFYLQFKQAEKQFEINITFICVDTDLITKLEHLSGREKAMEAVWLSTGFYEPLSSYTFECLPKEHDCVGEDEIHCGTTTNTETTINLEHLESVTLANQQIYVQLLPEEPDNNQNGLHSLFSKKSFGVLLNVSLLENAVDSSYSERDVRYLVNLVHTRFSNVMINTVDADTISSLKPERHIPRVAAKINMGKQHGFGKQADKPLQIYIPFHFDPTEKNFDASIAAFETAKKMADEANTIFSQTVKYLLINVAPSDEDTKITPGTKISDFITRLNKMGHQNPKSYYLGVIYPINSYHTEQAKQDLVPNLLRLTDAQVEFLLLRPVPPSLVSENDFDVYQNYTEKLQSEFPNMPIGLVYQTYDTTESYASNSYRLVEFWQKVNEYLVKKNTRVFMVEAFDNAHKKENSGWWRITKIPNSDEYLLQEKYQVVYNRTSFRQRSGSDEVGLSETVIISGLVAGSVVMCGVALLIYKLKTRRDTIAALSRLSPAEILEFFNGRKQPHKTIDSEMELVNREHDCNEITQLLSDNAYDRSLELKSDAFTLDDKQRLGSGAFGQVCIGRIRQDGNEVRVAVKRCNTLVAGPDGLKSLRSLLSEIKVMSYLGKHDNIVALLGAHTGNLSKGEVYVFLELCLRGSLENCLKRLRDSENNATSDPYTNLVESSYDVNPLAKWSLDIARGMEFLASKHVVHADLATRNVLLDANNKAKICDFGLSRRMMNYQSYVKTHQDPLPWRSMSPESLRNLVFNEKTDVWSFGVTMWQIYTLGDVPYSGLSWTVDFASQLSGNLRLPAPKHERGPLFGDRCMYPIMQTCWNTDPNKRPKFLQLVAVLTQELN